MEGLAFGIGILLAIFAPLLLIPVTWLLYRLLARWIAPAVLGVRASAGGARLVALATAAALVAVALVASYLPGKWEFDRLCGAHATPTLSARVQTDGFFRTRLYPYEARRWLESFAYVEAPHMYRQGAYVRYSRAGDEVTEEEVAVPRSRYGVRETFSEPAYGIMMTEKSVYEMASDRELARAASLVYEGGPLAFFLGVYGMSSCPDIRSEQGSRDFRTFYDLETVVLRAEEPRD